MKRQWIIYDARAHLEGTDAAGVLSTAHTERDGWDQIDEMFPGAALFVYDLRARPGKLDSAINEAQVFRSIP